MLPSFVLRLRNRLLADPKFLAFAQKFPLSRPVARSRSVALFDLLAGFSYSQVLYACVKLRVFEHVGQKAIGVEALASLIHLPVKQTQVLVRAAVALELLGLDGDDVILGPHGAALLGQPWIMGFVEHHAHFYRDLDDPVAMLQGKRVEGGLADFWPYDRATSDKSAYSALMAASQQAVSAQILGVYDFSTCAKLLDVGGGTGAFVAAVQARYPGIEGHVFDLPGVVDLERSPHITFHSGDFRRDSLPPGMDVISILRVLHDHDDDAVLALLKNVRTVCQSKTTLLIAEPFSGSAATARVTDAYFGMYFAAMGQGRTRTPAEITGLAQQAGFHRPKMWRTHMPLITGLMSFQTRP